MGADRVVLVWASRTPGDTFWNDELEDYQRKHPDRFELVRIYSRERVEGCLHGRVDAGVLAGIFGSPGTATTTGSSPSCKSKPIRTRFLSVGTKDMTRRSDRSAFPCPITPSCLPSKRRIHPPENLS